MTPAQVWYVAGLHRDRRARAQQQTPTSDGAELFALAGLKFAKG